MTDSTNSATSENMLTIGPGLAIPTGELCFRFSRSSGPGGQHVNTSSTRVELLYDVANSPILDEDQRAKLVARLSSYLDKNGVLHLASQASRSQTRNKEQLVRRFQSLVAAALSERPTRRPTRPSQSARERRLQQKRKRSEVKRQRRPPEM